MDAERLYSVEKIIDELFTLDNFDIPILLLCKRLPSNEKLLEKIEYSLLLKPYTKSSLLHKIEKIFEKSKKIENI